MQAPPTILIIDNDEGLVRALSVRLERVGYRCLTAGSGAQGLSIFRENDVDLIITDLNMPAGDGATLIGTIRKTSEVPVIVVTGFRDDFERELRRSPGVSILEKPFDGSVLLELVEAELALAGCTGPDLAD